MNPTTPMGKKWSYAAPAIMAAALCIIPRGHTPMPTRIESPAPAQPAARPVVHDLATLKRIVDASPMPGRTSRELDCLARTVYFEARSDGAEGQLAVATTVLNRTRAGIFPDTVCGVVKQKSQFSFVHDRIIPEVDRASDEWRRAVAVARIATTGWPSRAAKALFFHAAYVSPNWGRPSLGRIGAHLFYL